jgi:hypothetical protein
MKGNILGSGEIRAEREFLVDDADPQGVGMMRVFETDSFAANKDFAGIGLELPGQNINQGAFAGAVFTQERVNLAWMQDEVHALQRQRVAEAFSDAAGKDGRLNAHLFFSDPMFLRGFLPAMRSSLRPMSDSCVLAAFGSNNVIADILLSVNCCTRIDILDLFALEDIEKEANRFIALSFGSLIDGG